MFRSIVRVWFHHKGLTTSGTTSVFLLGMIFCSGARIRVSKARRSALKYKDIYFNSTLYRG